MSRTLFRNSFHNLPLCRVQGLAYTMSLRKKSKAGCDGNWKIHSAYKLALTPSKSSGQRQIKMESCQSQLHWPVKPACDFSHAWEPKRELLGPMPVVWALWRFCRLRAAMPSGNQYLPPYVNMMVWSQQSFLWGASQMSGMFCSEIRCRRTHR